MQREHVEVDTRVIRGDLLKAIGHHVGDAQRDGVDDAALQRRVDLRRSERDGRSAELTKDLCDDTARRADLDRAQILEPANRSEDEMLAAVTGIEADRLLFAGDALDSLAGAVRGRLGERASFMPPGASRAAHVAALALDPRRPSWSGRDREGRMPNYLRDADARKPRQRA